MKKPLRWLGRGLAFALLAWMVWDLIGSDHGYLVYRTEHEELMQLKQQVQELMQQRQKLAEDILRLREDPKALEELVHRELGYVYPDEYMLIVPADKEERTPDE